MLLLLGFVRHPTRTTVAPRQAVQLRMAVDSAEPCQDEDAIKADAEMAFALLDLNGNGSVEQTEFEKYLLTYGYTPPSVLKIFSALDLDGNGEISLHELRDGLVEYCRCAACEPEFIEQSHAEADALFDAADANDDDELSPDELRAHLLERGRYTGQAVEGIFRSIDANSDGGLSREELRTGFLQYERLRLAMVAVVTTLVKNKQWSPSQRQR